jgi:hypothetical protein
MKPDLACCTVEELWRFVAVHLERRGIGVVLVGGAVVSVYTEGAYRSGDLDFVREEFFAEDLPAAMSEIGFEKEGRHYRHPECGHLFVEFVSGPVGIGADRRIEPAKVTTRGTTIKLLSPTDSVRDRLAGFIHFGSRDYLDQAVMVAVAREIDWRTVERWCRGEGPAGPAAYAELHRRVADERERT